MMACTVRSISRKRTSYCCVRSRARADYRYNWFATQHSKEAIDTERSDVHASVLVEQLLNEWVKLARAKALAANGKIFEARDEILTLLQPQK